MARTRLRAKTVKYDVAELKWLGNYCARHDISGSQLLRRLLREFREEESAKEARHARIDSTKRKAAMMP